MSDRIQSFEEFWPFYVLEHEKKATRVLHFIGTTAAITVLGAAAITKRPGLVPLALVAGYGPAWFSHFFIEGNRPATFKYPLWSLKADFIMWGKMIAGTMDAEVEAAKKRREEAAAEEVSAPVNGVAHAVN